MTQSSIPARLLGRNALVTGASRGIGRAIAIRFAQEGARVAVNYMGDAAAAEAVVEELAAITQALGHEGGHFAIKADMGKPEEAEGVVREAAERFGRLDILVNNAGIQSETPGDGFDAATFAKIISVNLIGAAHASAAAIAHFRTRPGGGCIVNDSSVHQIIPKPGWLAYSVSKGGMGNLTRTLALETAHEGIRVNGVGPGAVVTDINAAWKDDPKKRGEVEAHIPMGRAATPEEIAPVFAFLASDDARYITGQTIFACGGLTLYADFAKNWSS